MGKADCTVQRLASLQSDARVNSESRSAMFICGERPQQPIYQSEESEDSLPIEHRVVESLDPDSSTLIGSQKQGRCENRKHINFQTYREYVLKEKWNLEPNYYPELYE